MFTTHAKLKQTSFPVSLLILEKCFPLSNGPNNWFILTNSKQPTSNSNKYTLTCLEFVLNNFFTTRRQKSESWSRSWTWKMCIFNSKLFHKHTLDMKWWIITNEAHSAKFTKIISYLTNANGIIALLKKNYVYWQQIWRAWYNGSYTRMG